jgi:hypothetical protein
MDRERGREGRRGIKICLLVEAGNIQPILIRFK